MRLDVPTLLVEMFVFEFFLALLMLLYAKHRKVYPGFALWTGSSFAVAAGYVTLLLRPASAPQVVAVFITMGLFLLAAMLRLDGTLRFVGRPGLDRPWYPLILPAAAALACFPAVSVRNLLLSVVLAGCLLACAWILKDLADVGQHLCATATTLIVIQCVGLMGRSVAWCADPTAGPLEAVAVQGWFFGVAVLGEVGLIPVFLLMNSLRLELGLDDSTRRLGVALEEFCDSLAHLKVLRGLLCICMHCKRIRVRGDHWEQVEDYVHQRSEAQFRHSLCPECSRDPSAEHAGGGQCLPPVGEEM